MIIRIDARSAEPLFEQVVFAVKSAVAKGGAAAGERLPSVRELARDLAINPNTVMRAYEVLERDGVVVRRQGAGCFLTGRGSELATGERKKQLVDLLRRASTEAFHLGFTAAEVKKALAESLEELQFHSKRSQP
ncbi:MAG TPA: GntR family transcriptional regulator [Planctomycetota bacterium]|nr:GntR family transcriptional regulator [Planctomycetota bacterium]